VNKLQKFFIILLMLIVNCIPFVKTNGPTFGLAFTNTTFPGEFNQSNTVQPLKSAEGCNYHVFNLFMWGDSAAGSISMENGIKRIASIDHTFVNVFWAYSEYCTIVKGE